LARAHIASNSSTLNEFPAIWNPSTAIVTGAPTDASGPAINRPEAYSDFPPWASEFRFAPRASLNGDHRMVGMTNSAPSLVPEGQREVTVLVLV
jgi:hypothetical protein